MQWDLSLSQIPEELGIIVAVHASHVFRLEIVCSAKQAANGTELVLISARIEKLESAWK